MTIRDIITSWDKIGIGFLVPCAPRRSGIERNSLETKIADSCGCPPTCTLGQVAFKKSCFSLSLPVSNEHASLNIKVYVEPEGIRENYEIALFQCCCDFRALRKLGICPGKQQRTWKRTRQG